MSDKVQPQVSLMSLFEVGAHRGNRKSRLNPKLKKQVYGVSKGLCLIDLAKTQDSMQLVSDFLNHLGSKRRQVLLVGTSKHLAEAVPGWAQAFTGGMPYVNSRWLGGTLTNWPTIKKTLKTLEKFEKIVENKDFFNKLSKNEQLNIKRKIEKIGKFFAGLVNLKGSKPGAILVLDASENPIAIQEADAAGVPVIVLTNTATITLPKDLKHTIVCNVHSLNALNLIMGHLVEAYNHGLSSQIAKTAEAAETKNPKKS